MLYLLLALAIYVLVVYRSRYTINNENGPYLTRYYLTGKWLRRIFDYNIFLHHFHQSDNREFHNHPWVKSTSYILFGGYLEWRITSDNKQGKGCRLFLPGCVNRINKETFHFVELLDERRGCWTLFCAGNNPEAEWGFLRPDGTYESAHDRLRGRDTLAND